MPRISGKAISLNVDGKTIQLKNPSKKNFELEKELLDPVKFRDFANDPAAFAKRFDLVIDKDIADKLAKKLQDVRGLQDLRDLLTSPNGINRQGATVWAVAEGAYSVATSKVAVAF